MHKEGPYKKLIIYREKCKNIILNEKTDEYKENWRHLKHMNEGKIPVTVNKYKPFRRRGLGTLRRD